MDDRGLFATTDRAAYIISSAQVWESGELLDISAGRDQPAEETGRGGSHEMEVGKYEGPGSCRASVDVALRDSRL